MRVLIIFCCFFAMGKRDKLMECENIQNLDKSERVALLKKHELVFDAFTSFFSSGKNYGKEYQSPLSDDDSEVYSTRYDIKDKIIRDQFNFHRLLAEKLKFNKILPYESYCFTDNTWGYLIYKHQQGDINYYDLITHFTLDELKYSLVFILEIFKILESNEAVVLDFDFSMIVVSFTGKMQLRPTELAHIYQVNKKCYSHFINSLTSRNIIPGYSMVRNQSNEKFAVVKASNIWNRFFFIDFMIKFVGKYLETDLKEQDKAVLQIFLQKLKKTKLSIVKSEKINDEWYNIEEWVKTLNMNDVLTQKPILPIEAKKKPNYLLDIEKSKEKTNEQILPQPLVFNSAMIKKISKINGINQNRQIIAY